MVFSSIRRNKAVHKKLWLILGIIALFLAIGPGKANSGYTSLDSVKIGESLFHGTSRTGDSIFSCHQCHNVTATDTFNWNPSAHEIALKFRHRSVAELEEVLFLPMTDAAFKAHEPILEFDPADVPFYKAYFDYMASQDAPIPRKDRSTQAYLAICLLLIFLALVDLMFTRVIKFRPLHMASITLALAGIFSISYAEGVRLGLQKDYQPDQPVRFSHKTHCGQNKIECLYCHMPAKSGKSAGIPAVSICMNCHAGVVQASKSGEFEIKKISDASKTGVPVRWIRVNNLPDHVYFNHAVHYTAGHIDCLTCHGNVKAHDQFVQETELSMGWCLDCHRDRKIDHGNAYYKFYQDWFGNTPMSDSISVRDAGGWECMKCHY